MRPKPGLTDTLRPAHESFTSNSHDANTMAGPIFSSVHPDIIKPDLIHTNDLIDNISAGETLPRAGPVGSPTPSPVAQFNRKHEVVAAMTVHITSMNLKGSTQRPAPAAQC
jgi:hypothetical protein